MQSSFEQIVSRLARRRYHQACSLSTWASSIAVRISLEALRARHRDRGRLAQHSYEDALAQHGGVAIDIEHLISRRRSLERLRGWISELPTAQAEAVVSYELLGRSLSEIAITTGSSVAAAQSRLVRGRKMLLARFAADQSMRSDEAVPARVAPASRQAGLTRLGR